MSQDLKLSLLGFGKHELTPNIIYFSVSNHDFYPTLWDTCGKGLGDIGSGVVNLEIIPLAGVLGHIVGTLCPLSFCESMFQRQISTSGHL